MSLKARTTPVTGSPTDKKESAGAKRKVDRWARRRTPIGVSARQETYLKGVVAAVKEGMDIEGKVGISSQATSVVADLMAVGFMSRVMKNANALALYNKKKTLTSRDLLYGCRVLVRDAGLRDDVTNDCLASVEEYQESYKDQKAKTKTKA